MTPPRPVSGFPPILTGRLGARLLGPGVRAIDERRITHHIIWQGIPRPNTPFSIVNDQHGALRWSMGIHVAIIAKSPLGGTRCVRSTRHMLAHRGRVSQTGVVTVGGKLRLGCVPRP